MASLALALDTLQDETLILFGDILFRKYLLQLLLDTPSDIVILVDSRINNDKKNESDLVIGEKLPSRSFVLDDSYRFKKIVWKRSDSNSLGEWVGLMKLSRRGLKKVMRFIDKYRHLPEFKMMEIRDMLNRLAETGTQISIQTVSGHWIDVNDIEDIPLTGEY